MAVGHLDSRELEVSILRPDTSVMLGIANGAIVLSIYNHNLPNAASIRVADSHDGDIESARKASAWMSAGLLGFMYLLTRDRNSFLIGGLVLGAVDYMVKHSNGLNPHTGELDGNNESIDQNLTNVYPLPDYSETDATDVSGY